MRHIVATVLCLLAFAGHGTASSFAVEPEATPLPASSATEQPSAKSRNFVFHYQFTVKNLKPSGDAARDIVRVWTPVPSTNEHQKVKRLRETAPAPLKEFQEAHYGNQLKYLELPIPKSGEFRIDLPYEIIRDEVRSAASGDSKSELGEEERKQLLAANKLIPTTGKPLELLKDLKLEKDSVAKARQLYDVVHQHVDYKKDGTEWGRGDTLWVCESGFGNCTDFHSLFISLARSQGMPAKFEIGFSIPTDKKEGPISGYHCWAWFHTPERGWAPVDISEADKRMDLKEYYFGNLTADRVMFSSGRDLELRPAPAHGPLNFFIHPYIEVGGETLPSCNVELQHSFQEQ
jgi:transglutaminase-like putative cysteine protease